MVGQQEAQAHEKNTEKPLCKCENKQNTSEYGLILTIFGKSALP